MAGAATGHALSGMRHAGKIRRRCGPGRRERTRRRRAERRGRRRPAEPRGDPTLEIFLSEYERWEARYAVPEYAFGKEPNYFLKSCSDLLPPSGRALAVADGEGRNGVWLAQQGLDVVSLDFSPAAQKKARALAAERRVNVAFTQADVHAWDYPAAAFEVVVEIFTQFSSPAERSRKWAGMRRTLKSGGLLILQGYTRKQLQYGTGGPKQIENLYTRAMLESEFLGFHQLHIVEEEREIHEGTSHGGMSAMIGLTGRKP
jgi:SAM-dependent methyltransferase